MSVGGMVWLLLGCASPRPAAEGWTVQRALAPTLAALDVDKSGQVGEAEYERVAFRAPTFAAADTDRDGSLSLDELRVIVYDADPQVFFPTSTQEPRRPPAPEERGAPGAVHEKKDKDAPDLGWQPMKGDAKRERPPDDAPREEAYFLLMHICEEIAAADPSVTLPDEERIVELSRNDESLTSPQARVLLEELEMAADKAGAGFPKGLRPAEK